MKKLTNTKVILWSTLVMIAVVSASVFAYRWWFKFNTSTVNTTTTNNQLNYSSNYWNFARQWRRFSQQTSSTWTKWQWMWQRMWRWNHNLNTNRGNGDCLSWLNKVELTDSIKDGLLLMREEEKLARDVYLTLNNYYSSQTQVFANIANSEQRHMDAIKRLLDNYWIEDPVKSNDIGVFTNSELSKLYNELVEKWKQSLTDALQVGVDIEKLDISDLEKQLSNLKDGTDIYQVYSSLLRWSNNHLRAFSR